MRETKEWTLMFYFASDNPLAISVVSQLKAIKAAGFHPDVNVVAQFDPYTPGTPTHIFDVNLINKLMHPGEANIGFPGNDPAVRNMIEDKLWRDERTRTIEAAKGPAIEGELVRKALHKVLKENHKIEYNPPVAPNGHNVPHEGAAELEEPDPDTSLRNFLNFCAEKYPAKHYILFLLGHGVVVGNDIFMLDEHASKHALSLAELGDILRDFKNDIEPEGAEFELVGFSSCSVSALEVAYELTGAANYMLASQGPTFVGSWPYRQILVQIFNDLEEHGSKLDIKEMMVQLFESCMFNSADFLLAGYSFQLTLCDLKKIPEIKAPLTDLTTALQNGLNDLVSTDFMLLSHWKAQSFYNEMFTDLYDFCFCFSNKVKEYTDHGITLSPQVQAINRACNSVMDVLAKEHPKRTGDKNEDQIIVAAEFTGPAYQYSRGLSVYFPWSEPPEDGRIMAEYEKYKFHTDFGPKSWLSFLRSYFAETMRDVSKKEQDRRRFSPKLAPKEVAEQSLIEDIASLVYVNEGVLDQNSTLAGPKGDPMDRTGFDSDSVVIKNYPRDIRARHKRRNEADKRFPVGECIGLLEQSISNNNH